MKGWPARLFAPHLAGWLFADLFVVLFLVALVSIPPSTKADGQPSLSAKPSVNPSPSPSPARSKPPVLNLKSVNFTVSGLQTKALLGGDSAAADDLIVKFQQQLRANGAERRRAGLVLAFGTAPNYAFDNQVAVRTADRLVDVVSGRLPLFSDVARRSLWTQGPVGSVQIEVFFFDE